MLHQTLVDLVLGHGRLHLVHVHAAVGVVVDGLAQLLGSVVQALNV